MFQHPALFRTVRGELGALAVLGLSLVLLLLAACGTAAPTETILTSHPPTATHPAPQHGPTLTPEANPHPANEATATTHPIENPQYQVIERFGVLELTFPWEDTMYTNPWEQVLVEVIFVSPSGSQVPIGGFYYGPGEWRARFAPAESGDWSWTAQISDGSQARDFSGSFTVTDGSNPGFVRSNPENNLRWVFDDGTPYYPIGIGDCILGPEGANPLNNFGFDGEMRNDSFPEGWRTDMETYFTAYGDAGFNLFRWSLDNCAFGLYESLDPAGNRYRQVEGIYGDQLVQSLRRHGLRTYLVIFGFNPPFTDSADDPSKMDAIRRYVQYVVNRYGAYVDFWELMNEAPNLPVTIEDSYYIQMATTLREVDPYDHPISTSWQRPDLAVIEINSPHWYQKESEFESDQALIAQLGHTGEATDKPIIFGEQGNSEQNWDERSGLRMRIRSWTAFFKEAALIFWNTSCCKDNRGGVASNIYLGPEERGYVSILQNFVGDLERDVRPAEVEISDPARVRGYALSGSSTYAAYLHAYTDHENPTNGIRITFESPIIGTASWIDPGSGAILGTARVGQGTQTLEAPGFITDVALKVNGN